jgi:hypothetical protein
MQEGATDTVTGHPQAYGKWRMLTRVIYRHVVARADGVITPKGLLHDSKAVPRWTPETRGTPSGIEDGDQRMRMRHDGWRWTERQMMMMDDSNEIRSTMAERLAGATAMVIRKPCGTCS